MNSLRLSAHRSIFAQTKKQAMARKTKDLHRQQQQQEKEKEKEKEQKHNRGRNDDTHGREACEQRAKKARESSENSENKQPSNNTSSSPPLIRQPMIVADTSVDDYCSHSGEYDGIKFEIMDTVSGGMSNPNNTHVITHSCSSPTSSKTTTTTIPAVNRSSTSNISNSFRINQNTGNLLRLTVPAGKAVRTVGGVLVACSTNIKVRKRMDLKASSVMKQLASVPTAALPMPLAVPLSLASGASSGGNGGGKAAASIWYDEITCEEDGVDDEEDEDGDGDSKSEGKNEGEGESEDDGKGDGKIDGDGDVAVDGDNNIESHVNVNNSNKKTTAGWVLLSLLNGQIHMLHLVDGGMHDEYTIMAGQFLASIGDVTNVKTKGMFATYKGNGIIFVITYGSSLSCTLEACDQDEDIDLNQDDERAAAAATTTMSPNDSFCVDRSKLIAWTSGTVTVEAVNKKFLPAGNKSIKAPSMSMSMSTSSTQNDLVQLSGSGHVIVQCNTGKQLASWLYDCKAPS